MRELRRFAIALVLVAACATPAPEVAPSTTAPPVRVTTTTTTTEPAPEPRMMTLTVRTRPDGSVQAAVVRVPAGATDAPLVVLFHGAAVSTDSVADLAKALMDSGVVVMTPETLIGEATGPQSIPEVFPIAIDDGTCAIEFARANSASWGADPARLMVVGHAAGGNVGAFAALDPVSSDESCQSPEGSVVRLVGLSSNPAATSEIGNDFRFVEGDPDLERLLDIRRLMGRNPDLGIVMLTLVDDPFAPGDGIRDFVGLVTSGGYAIELLELEGTSHSILIDPDSELGMLALEKILAVIAEA